MPNAGPLSFPQERIFFLQQLDPNNHSYRYQITLDFKGELDVAALQSALDTIVARHDMLRTTFSTEAGVPTQHVADHAAAHFRIVDVSSTADPNAETKREIAQALVEPFDIGRLPLARWTLVRVSPEHHILVHVEHHLIHDGWSFNVFLDDLVRQYRSIAGGTPEAFAAPPSFIDYVRQTREDAETERAREHLRYWRDTLAGAPKSLDLPTDRRRPPVQTHAGGAVIHDVPPSVLASIRRASRQAGATPFMLTLAVFAMVMQRYSGESDLCIGTGVAARDTPEAEQLIGMLVETLVLRLDLARDPTFVDLLERVRAVALGAYEHQHVPFDRVVEALAPVRDASVNPLFNVLFAFHDSTEPELDFGKPRVTIDRTLDNASAKIDLNVVCVPRPDGVMMKWEYNSDLFDRSTIERMTEHFDCLLEAVLDEPERRISRYAMMRAAERKAVTETFATNQVPYPRDRSVPAIFEATAQQWPDAAAIASDAGTLTYAELDARANRFAHYLVRNGAVAGTRVAMLTSRSSETIVAMLGILKAGCAYLPLDVRQPAERIAWTLEDASIGLTVTNASLHERLPGGAHTLRLDECGAEIAAESAEPLPRFDDPRAAAYVMYTSGSTGVPKGVLVAHRGIVRLACGMNHLTPGDVILQYSSPAFDGATYEIWGALLGGHTLAIPPAGLLSLAELDATIVRLGVTVLVMTTPLFHEFAERRQADLGALRLVFSGGDVLQAAPAFGFIESFPHIALINAYGPTEGTTYISLHRVTLDDARHKSIPIGKPIENTSAYVLDARDLPVPIDVPGEICTGGDGVALGYLNRPEQTAERFVDDPFFNEAGARMYRTGDIGRWRGDGTLEFLGRRDGQVKVRGFRVETGGIEATIRSYPGVRDAAVIAVRDGGDTSLAAYVVAGSEYGAGDLKAFLRARLADYEIPASIRTVEELPSSVGGKIDRAALGSGASKDASASAASESAAGFEAPAGEIEERIAAIWSDVLRVQAVGRTRDFFDLGGHSLMAMRVLARMVDAFGVSVSLREFFDRRTVAELARFIETAPRPKAHREEDFSQLSDEELDALLSAEERAVATDGR